MGASARGQLARLGGLSGKVEVLPGEQLLHVLPRVRGRLEKRGTRQGKQELQEKPAPQLRVGPISASRFVLPSHRTCAWAKSKIQQARHSAQMLQRQLQRLPRWLLVVQLRLLPEPPLVHLASAAPALPAAVPADQL